MSGSGAEAGGATLSLTVTKKLPTGLLPNGLQLLPFCEVQSRNAKNRLAVVTVGRLLEPS